MSSQLFVIDTSCLVQASRIYYPFDIAPSFWDFLKQEFHKGTLLMINKVKAEIDRGNDALSQWVQTEIPSNIHIDCNTDSGILANYARIIQWASTHPQYSPLAKSDFAEFEHADPFVVAAAMQTTPQVSTIVVSQEVSAIGSVKNIKLPDVCNQFSVIHIDTFAFLRAVGFSM